MGSHLSRRFGGGEECLGKEEVMMSKLGVWCGQRWGAMYGFLKSVFVSLFSLFLGSARLNGYWLGGQDPSEWKNSGRAEHLKRYSHSAMWKKKKRKK